MAAWLDTWGGRGTRHREHETAVADLAARHAEALEHFLAGRAEIALPLLEQIVLGCRTVLGERHPDTLVAEGNLAVAYFRAGHDDGLLALEEACAVRAVEFGPEDPRTLTAQEALAAAHRLQDRTSVAIRLGEDVVAARGRVLGAAHPDSLTSRLGLGLACAQAHAVPQALTILAAALDDAEAALGSRHQLTIRVRAALACCRALSGDLRAAAVGYDRAVEDAVAALGEDDPETVALREERDELGVPPA